MKSNLKELISLSTENELLIAELEKLRKDYSNLRHNLEAIQASKAFKGWQLVNSIKKNPNKIKKGIKILFRYGPAEILRLMKGNLSSVNKVEEIDKEYRIWFKKNWPNKNQLSIQKRSQTNFLHSPKISIITPVYNTDKEWLIACIESVINQTYENWELCLADDNSSLSHVKEILTKYRDQDKRIKIIFRNSNGHISEASNSALKIATGDYVALLDHDDELAPNALFEIVNCINDHKDADLIYSDEDKIEPNGKHTEPFFKPDWSPEMFYSVNYICHFTVIRKKVLDKVDGFRLGYEGSQDYDLLLRVIDLTKNIYHVPKVLYSWRKVPGSTASRYSVKSYANQASINALEDSLKRKRITGKVENGLLEGTFRIKYQIVGSPLVSIIIPTKNKIHYLQRCLNSLLTKTTYPSYEVVIIDTGSSEDITTKFYETLKKNKKIKILNWNHPFNYSDVNNFGVHNSKGEFIVFLNNDTEIITPGWIESMLEHAQKKEVGAVGAKLIYPDNRIQHAGVILGIKGGRKDRGVAGHAFKMFPDVPMGLPLLNSKDVVRNYTAVTAACLMIKKSKFLEVGGLDPSFRIAFNDVDFCLKLHQKGFYNVYTPYSKLYHHESVSVGHPNDGTRNFKEFTKEINLMIKRWDKLLENDPFYNMNLSKKNEDFSLNV